MGQSSNYSEEAFEIFQQNGEKVKFLWKILKLTIVAGDSTFQREKICYQIQEFAVLEYNFLLSLVNWNFSQQRNLRYSKQEE